MDITTAVVWLVGIVAIVYMVHLVITKKGDLEAGGRAGTSEFFLKAKERRK